MTTTWDELKFYAKLARNLFTRPHDLHQIPGPQPHQLFLLGNIPNIMRPDYHVQILDWANEYGGIYKFSLGCQWVVVISDPQLAAQVLGRGKSSVPRKCIGYQFFDLATNHLGRRSFFTTSDEQQWAAVRKAAAPAFNMANVRRSFPHVLRHAKTIADELLPSTHTDTHTTTQPSNKPHATSPSNKTHGTSTQQGSTPTQQATQQVTQHGSTQPQCADIQEHLELALLNVFVEALFDIEAKDFPGHEVAAAMNLVLEEANERLKVPLRGLGTWIAYNKLYRSVIKAQQTLGDTYGYLADVVRTRRGSPDAEASTNLWACLARLKDPRTGKPLTREQLIPEIGAFMMAGFDTSSHTIAWCLFTLATHPDAQERVRGELRERGLLVEPGVDHRDPSIDDLSQLPFLNSVIDETMRMYPVAATASVREVVEPVRVGEYTIPRGVLVWPMLYALHNSTHNWDHPEQFRPERWLEKHTHTHQLSSADSGALPPSIPTPTPTPATQTATTTKATTRSDIHAPATAAAPAGPMESYTSNHSTRKSETNGAQKNESSTSNGNSGVRDGRTSKAFLPFSDGMKNCLGQSLGLMEVRTVLVVLLSRFHFSLHPEQGSAGQITSNMIMSLTLKIKGGLNLVATPLGTPLPTHTNTPTHTDTLSMVSASDRQAAPPSRSCEASSATVVGSLAGGWEELRLCDNNNRAVTHANDGHTSDSGSHSNASLISHVPSSPGDRYTPPTSPPLHAVQGPAIATKPAPAVAGALNALPTRPGAAATKTTAPTITNATTHSGLSKGVSSGGDASVGGDKGWWHRSVVEPVSLVACAGQRLLSRLQGIDGEDLDLDE